MFSKIQKRNTVAKGFMAFAIVFSFMMVDETIASRIVYDVRDYGATGDGLHLDTKSIQAAIDDCTKMGGQVLLAAGTYLSGTIFLKDNVTLHISEGATLLGSTDIRDYPATTSPIRHYGDGWVKFSLISGENLENVAVVGRGSIDGQGGAYRVTTKKKPDRYMNRPYIIRFIACTHVLVENIRMRNSAMWMQHYLGCEDVTIRGIEVYNHCNKNNDMIDIDGCRNVLISDCIGDTDDDALTLKSTSERPCENVTITNCILSSHCNAIKMGTESHGGFRNVTISNVVIKPSEHGGLIYGTPVGTGGITLLIVDGGTLEGISISNIRIVGTLSPIFMRLGDRGRTYVEDAEKPPVGIFRDVHLSNIVVTDADSIGCAISGLPDHPVENVSLSHVRISFRGGGTMADAQKIVPEKPEDYPRCTMFGNVPAYGVYIRHAKGMTLHELDLDFEHDECRPAVVCDDVDGLDISGLRASGNQQGEPLIRLVDTKNAFIGGSRPHNDIELFLSLDGERSEHIYLVGNDLNRVTRIYDMASDVNRNAVKTEGNIK